MEENVMRKLNLEKNLVISLSSSFFCKISFGD